VRGAGLPPLVVAVTLIFVALCMAWDVRTLRVPNVLTFPAIVMGLVLNAWLFGVEGLRASALGCTIAIGLLFAPFALGGVGGGDVKMMGAVGAFLGPTLVLACLVVGLALGGVFAVLQLAGRARLREKLVATAFMVRNAVLARSLEPLKLSPADSNAVAFPYSVPLGLGTASVIAISVILKP
jgi:prepilin peptidase CpaA